MKMHKILSLVLVLCLMLSCLAVASAEEEDELMAKWNSETQYILDNYSAFFEEDGLGDVMQPYEETVTLSLAKFYTAADETRVATFNERYGETFESNRWTYITENALNITFDYEWWALNGDDYNQKLRLEMAAGNLPDVFTATQSDVLQLAEAGLIIDVSDLIEQYASTDLKEILSSDGGMGYDMVSYDGGVYGIPKRASDTDAYSYLFIRKDWMEALNLEWPSTIDDLENIMKAFSEADFDGNGEDDTVGMAVNKSLWYLVRGLCSAYGAYPEYWVEDEEGNVVFGATQPEMKDALSTLRHFFEEGYIDPEFATQTETVALEAVLNGKCGVVYGGHWLGHTFGDLHELDPDSEWVCMTLPPATARRSALR